VAEVCARLRRLHEQIQPGRGPLAAVGDRPAAVVLSSHCSGSSSGRAWARNRISSIITDAIVTALRHDRARSGRHLSASPGGPWSRPRTTAVPWRSWRELYTAGDVDMDGDVPVLLELTAADSGELVPSVGWPNAYHAGPAGSVAAWTRTASAGRSRFPRPPPRRVSAPSTMPQPRLSIATYPRQVGDAAADADGADTRRGRGITMKRSLLVPFAALAMALGLSDPASAASPPASCQALVSSSFAGQPGARAAELQDAFAEAAERGVRVGAVLSEFSRVHGGSIEGCFE
jgi:hypothetical protein